MGSKKKLSSLLDSLDALEDYAPTVSFGTFSDKREDRPSQTQPEDISTKNDSSENGTETEEKPKKKKKSHNLFDDGFFDDETTSWLDTVDNLKVKKGNHATMDDFMKTGRPKKKKKKKNGETDFNKEFSPELAVYQKLSADQIAFTDSLQRRYDAIEGAKSSARGISKFTNDLIMNLNSARNTSMAITDKIVALKKAKHDLHLKEVKELGLLKADDQDMDKYSSQLLNNIVNRVGRNNLMNGAADVDNGYDQIPESNPDDIADDLMEGIEDYDPSEESDSQKYLKYEKADVKIHIVYNQDTGDWHFKAITENGEEVPDYPLPDEESLSMKWNKGSGFGTDQFGRKYPIILADE